MASGGLLELGLKARLAYPAIVRGVREGLSMQAIGEVVREAGIRIANESLRQAIRQTRDSIAYASNLKFLGSGTQPNYERLPLALGQLQRRFSFQVEIATGLFDANGQELMQHVTVSTDRKLTKGQILDAANKAVTSNSGYGFKPRGATIVGASQAGFEGTL